MKLEYDTNKDAEFKPIKIILVIESKDELMELWHRFNITMRDVKRISVKEKYFPEGANYFLNFRNFLDMTAIERGIIHDTDEE
jgi:hypothetical protein